MMSLDRSLDMHMAHWDISRAHFMPTAEIRFLIQLPDEDRTEKYGVGLLGRTMYGTQDASNLFQMDYSKLLAGAGFTIGNVSPATFSRASEAA